MSRQFEQRSFKVFQRKQLEKIPQVQGLSQEVRESIAATSAVFPFRVNNYVIDELIDWSNVPDDPMFQLTFPQRGMLSDEDYARMVDLVRAGDEDELKRAAQAIQMKLNPHPAGQLEYNVPQIGGQPIKGMQHKYQQTALFFPAHGQTCHAYCTYCFRWAQFVGMDDLKFIEKESSKLIAYLKKHSEVSDVLFTGGDPMVMGTKVLRRYIDPILEADVESLRTIRIGTKAPAYWPYRFVNMADSDDLMRLFEEIVDSGRHLAIMAHFSHPVELETPIAAEAIRRIRSTGATVRCQAPLIRHVNDDADTWATMWQRQVELGAVPYYMFVERDTGARQYFEVPLFEATKIFNSAYRQVSGLARTVRGPSMSSNPGKVLIDGVSEVGGEKVFVLKFLQGRNAEWANRIFYAKYDEKAVWLDDLKPAFGEKEFFFERYMRALKPKCGSQSGGDEPRRGYVAKEA